MPSIHGNFAMHRITTSDGRNAVMIVPERTGDQDLRYSTEEMPISETTLIEFLRVENGTYPPDSYLTLNYPESDLTIRFGPYVGNRENLN